MLRASCYVHPEGDEKTVATISEALVPHASHIVNANLQLYDSTDMQIGRNIGLLTKSKSMLADLVRIDGRGGFFTQSHISSALKAALDVGDWNAMLLGKTIGEQRTEDEILGLISYKIRVMLSHVRIIYDAHDPQQGRHALQDIFEVISGAAKIPQVMDARKARRMDRISRRPNPFVCFRQAEQSAKTEEEEASIITTYYDGHSRVAKMLLSDGTTINADQYTTGPDGFIVAEWLQPPRQLNLEVPNGWLCDSKIQQPTGMKRPAATRARAGEGVKKAKTEKLKKPEVEEEKEEGECEEAREETVVEVKLGVRPGHDNIMTIVVFGKNSKDKAQLLAITPGDCEGLELTPRSACEAIIKELTGEIAGVSSSVRGADWLGPLREKARKCRAELCDPS